jgi:hypothetical protein
MAENALELYGLPRAAPAAGTGGGA